MTYQLIWPDVPSTGAVFASPHSGRHYPADMREKSVLSELEMRSSEDAFVDELIEDATQIGAPVLKALLPRAYVDLNRSAEELDPALVRGAPRSSHNPRVSSGLGVIPRVVANGKAIYHGKLSLSEAKRRIDTCWMPYHAALEDVLLRQRAEFGVAVLLDFHSMPHEAIESAASARSRAPDVVLGDRFGASASVDVVDRVAAAFEAEGLRVARNSPFAGAYISQQYGRPSQGQHAVQIELDRALYMDEKRIVPHSDFAAFRTRILSVISEIAEIGRPAMPVAAE